METGNLEATNTKEYLDMDETIKLEEAALYFRDQVLIRILRRLGCRISEALGIEVKHVDFKNRTITIEHEKVRIKRWCPFCLNKGDKVRLSKKAKFCPVCGENIAKMVEDSRKDREYRCLPVDEASLKMVKEYIERGGPIQVKDGRLLLFGITRQYAWQIVKTCAERANLPKIINVKHQVVHNVSPHKLRDAFATNAANADSSMEGMRRLQEHLGHQEINTTMKYVRVTGQQHRDWFEKVAKEKESEEGTA